MLDFSSPIAADRAAKISPVTLAFVGDAVFSLYVREKLVRAYDLTAGQYQKRTAELVSATGQARLAEVLRPHFTAEEDDIFRRGRNAKKPSHSKNAPMGDYNTSTGLEALIGWLYLTGQRERLKYLLEAAQ